MPLGSFLRPQSSYLNLLTSYIMSSKPTATTGVFVCVCVFVYVGIYVCVCVFVYVCMCV